MERIFKDIILRDFIESDIADEIRWFSEETAWMVADTPWEPLVPVDEDTLRKESKEMLQGVSAMNADAVRNRLEIVAKGEHIGFVCFYPLEKEFKPDSTSRAADGDKEYYALGIEICEPSFWGKGYGTLAMVAAIKYYQSNGYNDLYLETWSGNIPMLRCAEKLGFDVNERKLAFRQVGGKYYDALTLLLNNDKFARYLNDKQVIPR